MSEQEVVSERPMECTVFVELLGEGIRVWRPVPAEELDVGYRLLAPMDYDPTDEEWEFVPGTIVDVEVRFIGGKEEMVAVKDLEPA